MKDLQSQLSEQKSSILQQIIDGSLKIGSISEIENILEIYPDEPLLLRRYADLLCKKRLNDKAFTVYDQAARLFIDNSMNLQAIVAKILQWSIRKPTHTEGRRFHSLLHEEGAQHTPLQRFWARMTYPELVTIMLRLVRIQIAGGKKILSPGESVNQVYFVVSGMVCETAASDIERKAFEKGIQAEPVVLGPNDIFGDIFPIDRLTTSCAEIRSISEVELIKISKKVLISACRKYPRIQRLLEELRRSERPQNFERAWQTVRRTTRFGLPTQVDLIGHSAIRPQKQWRHTGIALDLSVGGMCIDLGPSSSIMDCGTLNGQIVQAFLDLHNGSTINLSGVIVWSRSQSSKHATSLIGIRFDSMSAANRQLLTDYCSVNNGEQNLLLSLWDTMVRVDHNLPELGGMK